MSSSRSKIVNVIFKNAFISKSISICFLGEFREESIFKKGFLGPRGTIGKGGFDRTLRDQVLGFMGLDRVLFPPPNLWTCIYFPISFPLKFGQLPFGRAVVSEVERFGGFFFDSTKVQCNEEAFVHGMRS